MTPLQVVALVLVASAMGILILLLARRRLEYGSNQTGIIPPGPEVAPLTQEGPPEGGLNGAEREPYPPGEAQPDEEATETFEVCTEISEVKDTGRECDCSERGDDPDEASCLPEGGDESPGEEKEEEKVNMKGGSIMVDLTDIIGEKVTIKTERVVGRGTRQILIEESKTIQAIKIVEIVPRLVGVTVIVKNGKVIVQGTVHKQIFFIGADNLEHHLAEDIPFSELVDIEPIDPRFPAREGMNPQDHSFIENLVFEFDPATGLLIQKIIVKLDITVTNTEQIGIGLDPYGPFIKTQVVVGHGMKQKLIEETKAIPGIKVVEVVPTLTNLRTIVKNGKVIVQGRVHKQIFFVGLDDLIHHIAEDLDFSDLVDIVPIDPNFPAREGQNAQNHSFVENLVIEFDPATGLLTQKVIILLDVKVTETEQIPVALDPYGVLIKTELVIGHGTKQKLIEETKTIPAIKIVEIVPTLRDVTSIVKDGKVIVQGILHKQIFFVGTDELVHHISEDIPFSEMVEITPLDPSRPVREGMNQQDHSIIENLVFNFDPATGLLTQKVIIRFDIKVTETQQIRVADPA